MLFGHRDEAKGAGWMITLADLLSLLVSFFALLYATTATDPSKWNRVVKPISAYLTGAALPDSAPAKTQPPKEASDGNYGLALLRNLIESDPALANAHIGGDRSAIRIGLPSRQDYSGWISTKPSPLAGLGGLIRGLRASADIVVYRQGSLSGGGVADLWQDALREAGITALVLKDSGVDGEIAVTGMIENGPADASRLDIAIHMPAETATTPSDAVRSAADAR